MFLQRSKLSRHCEAIAGNPIRAAHQRTETTMSFKSMIQKVRDWQRYRESVRELSKLSDRELSDLGITRVEIEYVTKHGVRHV